MRSRKKYFESLVIKVSLLGLEICKGHKKCKGCVNYIFPSLFCLSKREHFRNKKKMIFISLQKLFLFLKSSDFYFSDIQMS